MKYLNRLRPFFNSVTSNSVRLTKLTYQQFRAGFTLLFSRTASTPDKKLAAQSLIEPALSTLIVFIALAILLALAHLTGEWFATRSLHHTYAQLTGVNPSALAAQIAQRNEMIKRLSANRLIAPPPEFQLTGVLGDAAIFNGGMLLKAGQSAGDMKILTVGPNWIEVQQNGQTQKMYVFQPMPPQGQGGMPPGMPSRPSGKSRSRPPEILQ